MKITLQILFAIIVINASSFAKDDWFDDEFYKDYTKEEIGELFSMSGTRPFIDLNVGINTINIDKSIYSKSFSEIGNLNGKFGFVRRKSLFESNSIHQVSNNYLYIDYLNKDNPLSKENNLNTNSKIWQIGFGDDDSYSYNIGDVINIDLSNNSSYGWASLNFKSDDTDSNNIKYLDYINDGIRFSNSVGNDIKILYDDSYGISAGYNRTIIYQRHLFWYWAGSEIIYQAGSNMIDWFVKSIARRNSSVAPIVYFALHSAYNYGMYELRKDAMNWPFETSPGFIYDNFKIGISLRF